MFKDIDEILLSSKFLKQRGYWVNKLSPGIVKTELPVKAGRKREATGRAIEKIEIPVHGDLFQRLMKLGKQSDLSLYIILLTALKVLLYRYTNHEDVIVISPVYRKNRTEETLNDYLFIRDSINDSRTFIEMLLEVRKSVLEAYENQDYPAHKLVEYLFDMNSPHIKTGSPVSDIVCLLEGIHDNPFVEDVQEQLIFLFKKGEKQLKGHILYRKDVYESGYVQLIVKHFTGILANAAEDVKTTLSEISLSSKEDERQLIFDLNRTGEPYPEAKTLVELFEEQVEKTPAVPAVIHQDRQLTYVEINKKANQLARTLRARNVKRESITAIMMERSIEMVIGLLAVWKAGGTFLPIDDEYPEARKQFILEDSETRVLLTQEHIFARNKNLKEAFLIEQVVVVDNEANYSMDAGNLDVIHDPINLAYVIYTSGTTGKPKGVMISHQAIFHYTWWAARAYVRNEAVNFPLYTSISFDLTMTSIFTPLVTGNAIVVYGEEDVLSIERIIAEDKVGVIKLTPSHLKLIKYRDGHISAENIKRFIVGGEELERDLALAIHKKFNGNIEIYNEYGPTEATVGCMIYKFDPREDYGRSVPIGGPIDNTGIYILDRHLKPVPFGVVGELCIGGVGVARGYLKRDQLTAQRFIDNPFIKGQRLFRSGDLALRRLDGNIDFLGRLDSQVKISGFRIEPEEIENRLLNHDEIKEAVVIARELNPAGRQVNGTGDKYLCAYIISDRELEAPELREYLTGELPHYMIPAYFVRMETFPLTGNGKIDRKALPVPEIKAGRHYVAPRNQLEQKLVHIWSDVLGVEQGFIGIDASFFEMGGNSIKAIILMSRIHKELNVNILLAELFESPTVRGLAETIKELNIGTFASIEPAELKEYYGLSSSQKRFYVVQHLDLGNTSYNVPGAIILKGDIKRENLENAFRKLIARHQNLRTSFITTDDIPVQVVHKQVDFAIDYYDARENEVDSIVKAFVTPFDLGKAPLLRVGIISVTSSYQVLIFDLHHIITDGISQEILKRDFLYLYPGAELPVIHLHYKDFVEWQNREAVSGKLKQQEEYWLSVFKQGYPTLMLPTDYPRPDVMDIAKGDTVYFEIRAPLAQQLYPLLEKTQTTLYMFLLAVFNVLLTKYSGQEDIVVGTPLSGRSHADLQDVIGLFLNMVAVRNFPARNKIFKEFLMEVKENALNAYQNQDYPFDALIVRLGLQGYINRNPLFDVELAVNTRGEEENIEIPGIKIHPYRHEVKFAKFDLHFAVDELEDRIKAAVRYSTQLFQEASIEKMCSIFVNILEQVMENIDIKIKDIVIPHEYTVANLNIYKDDEDEFEL